MDAEKSESIWKLVSEEADRERRERIEEDRQDGEITFREYREITGYSEYKASRVLNQLLMDGKITRRKGKVKNSPGYYYKLIELKV